MAIYALCEPDTGEPRYVGSAINPRERLKGHRSKYSEAPLVRAWLASLGRPPELRILDGSGLKSERWWMNHYIHNGHLLLNVIIGNGVAGESPRIPRCREPGCGVFGPIGLVTGAGPFCGAHGGFRAGRNRAIQNIKL